MKMLFLLQLARIKNNIQPEESKHEGRFETVKYFLFNLFYKVNWDTFILADISHPEIFSLSLLPSQTQNVWDCLSKETVELNVEREKTRMIQDKNRQKGCWVFIGLA